MVNFSMGGDKYSGNPGLDVAKDLKPEQRFTFWQENNPKTYSKKMKLNGINCWFIITLFPKAKFPWMF